MPNRLSPEARRYAVRELARRAGVTRDFFQTWKIEVTPSRTTVTIPGTGKSQTILFEHAPPISFANLGAGRFPVARAKWFSSPKEELLCDSLILPFVVSTDEEQPLFFRREDGSFVCQLDVLLSTLLTLSRAEEFAQRVSDVHGRFPASASLAQQHGFLERPIVDECGLALAQAIQALLPAWQPARHPLRVKLTHDIDSVGIPFHLHTTVAHTLKRRKPAAMLQDFVSCFSNAASCELALVRVLAGISKARGLHSAFFWKASPAGPHDTGYDPMHPKVQKVIEHLRSLGFELGVHPGYDTFGDPTRLHAEVALLQQALGTNRLGGRQHYLRWAPQTWMDWESCGLAYDSTLGFADAIGFRAGTSFPFRPWNLKENREIDLIEIPLVVMDCTPVKYMGLTKQEGLARIQRCIARITLAGGVFTLLWHNTPLIEPEYAGWYESVLNMLPVGTQNFAVPPSAQAFW